MTDGEEWAALAIVRSLGRVGHEVQVVPRTGSSLAGASRYAGSDRALSDPLAEAGAFAEELARELRKRRSEIPIPVTEASLQAVLPNRSNFDCLLPFPSLEVFQKMSDKAWVVRVARHLNIRVPDQVEIPKKGWGEELPEEPGRSFELKPARSVEGGRKLTVSYARGGEDLQRAVGCLPKEAFPLLIQEGVVGPGAGVFLLVWKGELGATFAYRWIREKPPSGVVSVLRESVQADPCLVESSLRLLQELDWSGVAMVEFKMEEATHTPFLMEVNGRFWGSLQLAVDSGVDFPALLVDAALGSEDARPPTYSDGVRLRWLLGDLDHLLARLRRSREQLNLPADASGRLGAVKDFLLTFGSSTRTEVLRASDPGRFFRELIDWASALREGR